MSQLSQQIPIWKFWNHSFAPLIRAACPAHRNLLHDTTSREVWTDEFSPYVTSFFVLSLFATDAHVYRKTDCSGWIHMDCPLSSKSHRNTTHQTAVLFTQLSQTQHSQIAQVYLDLLAYYRHITASLKTPPRYCITRGGKPTWCMKHQYRTGNSATKDAFRF